MKHGFATESEREFVWRGSFVTRKPTRLTGAAIVRHNRAMKDLTSAAWIKFKGLLFLFLGVGRGDVVAPGESNVAHGGIAGAGDLELLPELLLRVLRHREICGPEL
jgi:hypothetical protein